jgi:ectoine hydroxylase-related dioxygenase (phytanoyl-CoA dioxygenase family)
MYADFYPETTLENLNTTLDTHGVAVLPRVFSEKECDDLKVATLRYLAQEYSVFTNEDFKNLHLLRGGMFHNYGASLTKEILDFKTDERTIEPFKRIWNTNELTVSLDGLYLSPPPVGNSDYFDSTKNWFHTDQASNKKNKCCIQASINLEHIEHGDGCLSVLLNSHKYHAEFFNHFGVNSKGRDWFLLNNSNHFDWYTKEKGCEWKMIMAPKGSIVFWDSRTIHMGTLPRRDERVNVDRWRFIVYVCYTSAHLQTNEDTKLKRMAYVNNRNTSHWPYNVNVFAKTSDDTKINDFKSLSQRHKKYIFGIED